MAENGNGKAVKPPQQMGRSLKECMKEIMRPPKKAKKK